MGLKIKKECLEQASPVTSHQSEPNNPQQQAQIDELQQKLEAAQQTIKKLEESN